MVLQLNLASLVADGLYTVQTDDGDTLVARWHGDPDLPEKAVWLWDTPFRTIFLLEISPTALEPDALQQFAERTLLWDRDPLRLRSLKLTYEESIGGKQRVRGLGEYRTNATHTWFFWFNVLSVGDRAYATVSMSKPITSAVDYPAEAFQVPERFPPLRLRLSSLPRHALFDELGRGYASPKVQTYPTHRDAIVLRELLSRGPLSDVEIRQIILGLPGTGDDENPELVIQRTVALVRMAAGKKDLELCAPGLERLLSESNTDGYFWVGVVGHVLGAMETNHVDFSRAAMALVERGQFAGLCLQYLEKNGADEETLRRLAAVKVKPSLEVSKKNALGAISSRVSVGARPR